MRSTKERSTHQIDVSVLLWWACHNLLNQTEGWTWSSEIKVPAGQYLVRTPFLDYRQQPTCCVLIWQKERERAHGRASERAPLVSLLIRALTPPWGLQFQKLIQIYLPKVPSPNNITLWVRAPLYDFAGGHSLVYSRLNDRPLTSSFSESDLYKHKQSWQVLN